MQVAFTPLEFMRRARKLYADREAVVDGAQRFTYAQFFDRCERRDVEMIVTTEKDFVRFPEIKELVVPIYFLRVEIEIVNGKEVFDRMVRILCEPRGVPKPVYGSELIGRALEE